MAISTPHAALIEKALPVPAPTGMPAYCAAVIDALPAAIVIIDAGGQIVALNQCWSRFGENTGTAPAKNDIGASYFDACTAFLSSSSGLADEAALGIRSVLAGTRSSFTLVCPYGASNQMRWFQLDARPLGAAPSPGAVVMHTDISEHERVKLELDLLIQFDALTGLPNRQVFHGLLGQAVALANREEKQIAVMSFCIDRFGAINDTLGHQAGDDLLRTTGTRLRETLRASDTLSRVGSDESCMLLPGVGNSDQAAAVARKLIEATSHPVEIDGKEIYLIANIGISLYPADASDPDGLVRYADTAMRAAKSAGQHGFHFFTNGMNAASATRMQLETDLRRALERDEFILQYQPKVDGRTGRITGVEALLRWQHPERGLVAPAEFIPLLEETGLIVPVGAWTLHTACAQASAWQQAGLKALQVAVNLSGRQLLNGEIIDCVKAALAAARLDPALLELELTESYLMQDPESAVVTLTNLKKLGLRISIDDFGTGYSSLAYLKKFPIDTLKIDRTFVKDISADPDDASITLAIITLAHTLKLSVVAEGVETAAQLGLLTANHCDSIQGYYFSPPVDADAIAIMLREGKHLSGAAFSREKQPRTLLLVDDEENIRNALKRLLRRASYRVLIAGSGPEGLRLMAENQVDVVLSDQRMPGMTGVEFLRRVKEIHPQTVRIVLSGYTELQSVTDAINAGAIYKFLTKPWDDAHLLANIEEAFRHKEMVDENRWLGEKVQEANTELSHLNLQLEETLREKSHQATRSEGALSAALEVLQHVPVPLLGIDDDGLIAVANGAAEALLSAGAPLLGRFTGECLPASLLVWLQSGSPAPAQVEVRGASYRVSRHAMGESSGAAGTMLIMEYDMVTA